MNISKILDYNRNLYHNGHEPDLTDAEYDALELKLRATDPANSFFIGVGSEVRGDKVKLPFEMGSLTQIYENEFDKWCANNRLKTETFIITGKMDGVSVLLVYDHDGNLNICYSRGNGYEGQDITRHIKRVSNVPNKIKTHNTKSVRAECIISKANFKKFQEESIAKKTKLYKNPRNAIAGLMNSKEIQEWIYKYIDVIAYEVLDESSKSDQLNYLIDNKFTIVPYSVHHYDGITDLIFKNTIIFNKNEGPYSEYEQDGIVIDIDSLDTRNRLYDKSELNPKFSRKYKIVEETNIVEAVVTFIEWRASKNRLIKPRIHIKPVELNGVTITHTNGFNARYIVAKSINIGSKLLIIRSGDVIPHIVDVITKSDTPSLPDKEIFGDYLYTESGADLILLNESDDTIMKSTVSFFESLNIPLVKMGNVKKLFKAGYTDIASIINASESELCDVIGTNGTKIFDGINKTLLNVTEYDFVGSLPYFPGVGKRMFEKLYDRYDRCGDLTVSDIIDVDGFEDITALKITANIELYYQILMDINRIITFVDTVSYSGKFNDINFVFSGYRDKAVEKQIIEQGGTIQSGIKSDTTYLVLKDTAKISDKVKKAQKMGTTILSIPQLLEIL